jgi:hypothetical protein
MSKIYVANTTLQHHTLSYRIPVKAKDSDKPDWSGRLRHEEIRAGQTVALASGRDDFGAFEFEQLFSQQADHYGACRPDDAIKGARGFIWDTQPIDVRKIRASIKSNQQAAADRSERMIDATAVAGLTREQQKAAELDAPQVKRMEVEVVPESNKKNDGSEQARGAEATADGVAPKNKPTR